MLVFSLFVPVRVGVVSVVVHRGGYLRAMNVAVMVQIVMGVAVGMAQCLMEMAVGMFFGNQEPGARSHKKECDDELFREFMEYQQGDNDPEYRWWRRVHRPVRHPGPVETGENRSS